MSDVIEELLAQLLGPATMALAPPATIPESREKPHKEAKRRPSWGTAVVKPRQQVREIPAGTDDPARSRPVPTKVPLAGARAGEGFRW
jgi:hypothetical protein